MKKYQINDDTMNESQLQRVYNYNIYPRDSKMYSDKGFVNVDNGSQGGTHWTCFIVQENNHTILTVSVFSQINFY